MPASEEAGKFFIYLDIGYPLYYTLDMYQEQKKIIDHISRLEGQLASVKKELANEAPDCEKASKTLQSASRSFAGLREQFVETFLLTHFIDKKKATNTKLFEALIALIKS